LQLPLRRSDLRRGQATPGRLVQPGALDPADRQVGDQAGAAPRASPDGQAPRGHQPGHGGRPGGAAPA
jgi:hypothetical protein